MSIPQYQLKERIGIGSYGMVFKAQKKNDKKTIFVIKQIPFYTNENKENIEEAKNEARILKKLDCKYIVKYYDSYEENNTLNIVMEYCQNGDLSSFINDCKKKNKILPENQIWQFFIEMSLGLSYMHYHKILHRDLKTLNIFLTKDLHIKIGDLGVAKILQNTIHAHTFIGTPYYLSPEMCEEKPYNEKSDVWALGCILYELITFKKPYSAKNQAALFFKITNGHYEPISNSLKYSKDLKKIVDMLLEKNYIHRPNMKDVIENNTFVEKCKKLNLYDDLLIILSLYGSQKFNERNSKSKKIQKITYVKPEQRKNSNNKILNVKNKNNGMYKSDNNLNNNYKSNNIYVTNVNSIINQSEEMSKNIMNDQIKKFKIQKEIKKERQKTPSLDKFYLSNNLSHEKVNNEIKNNNYKARHSEVIKKHYQSNNNLRYVNQNQEIGEEKKKNSFVQNNNVNNKKQDIKHISNNNINKITTPQTANPNIKIRINTSRTKSKKLNDNNINHNNNKKSNSNYNSNNNINNKKNNNNNISNNSNHNNSNNNNINNIKNNNIIPKVNSSKQSNLDLILNKIVNENEDNKIQKNININKKFIVNNSSKNNQGDIKKYIKVNENSIISNNILIKNYKKVNEMKKSQENKINKSAEENKSRSISKERNLKKFINKSQDKSISNDSNISDLNLDNKDFKLKIKNINPNNLINDFISELNKGLEKTNKLIKRNNEKEEEKIDYIPLYSNKNEEEVSFIIESEKERNLDSPNENSFIEEDSIKKKNNDLNKFQNLNNDKSDSNSNISNEEEEIVSVLPNKENQTINEEKRKQLNLLYNKWKENYDLLFKEFWAYDKQINCQKILEICQEAENSEINVELKNKLDEYIKAHLSEDNISKFKKIFNKFMGYDIKLKYVKKELEKLS